MSLSNNQWRTIFGVVAAVASFLLLQPQVQDVVPLAIFLGCVNVAVAVIRAPEDSE